MLSPKWATRLFIAAIVGATISMGLFFNVTGPTLPTLAANCGTSVKTLSWIFTVRAGIHESKGPDKSVDQQMIDPKFRFFDP